MNEQEILHAAIRGSGAAWFESNHCKIYGKDRKSGLIQPRCNYLQTKIQQTIDRFELLGLPIRICGLKPRQKGSTTFFAAQDYTFLRRHSASVIVIGGQYSQVSECWDMLQTYSNNDTFDWKNTGAINSKDGKWSNGSKLRPETAKDVVAGIGGTHQVLHCFEVAKWAKSGVAASSGVLSNITKCVPNLPDTMIILESTAEGQSGSFYEKFVGSVDAEKFVSGEVELTAGSFVRTFAPWFEFEDSAIRLTEEQKRQIQATLDVDAEYDGEKELMEKYGTFAADGVQRLGTSVQQYDVWEQLAWRRWSIHEECEKDKDVFDRDYPHSWEVAFQKSGKSRFNSTGISVLKKRAALTPPTYGIIEETKGRFAFRTTEQNEATHIIFEKPKQGYRYILPVDPMTGASQTTGVDPDRHAAGVLRQGFWGPDGKWVRAALAARVIPCRFDIDVLERLVWRLARFYGGASQSGCIIAPEMNMERGLVELLKLRGANFYMREVFNKREEKTTEAIGYSTNEKTREVLVERLAAEIREWNTPGRGLDCADPTSLEELENFIRKENGRCEAAEGFKDDSVIMLGLGVELIDHATLYVPERVNAWFQPPSMRPTQPATPPGAYS